MRYCPIIRNFNRIRRVLGDELGLPRNVIRPTTTFAEVVPRKHRRRVWRRFRREGIDLDRLDMSGIQLAGGFVAVGAGLLCGYVLSNNGVCVPTAIIAGIAAFFALLPWATVIDPSYTLGDAALGMTSVRECRAAGYQFTHNEIFLKVRRALVHAYNLSYADVKLESKLSDLE